MLKIKCATISSLLLLISTPLFALDCGFLGITLSNATKSNCVIKHAFLHGDGSKASDISKIIIPMTIRSGETTPTFFIPQFATKGGAILDLDYRCGTDKAVAKFQSIQSYCAIQAGNVTGIISTGNDVKMEYEVTLGDYSNKVPGQIHWTIR